LYRLILLIIIFNVFLSMVPLEGESHRSGCHRWHSCPSHTDSYECGDLGHDDYCSSNDDSDEDDDSDEENNDNESEREKEKDEQEESPTLPKSTMSEGIELTGIVTYIVDGDTLDVNDIRIRLTLVDTPERGEKGYQTAKNFLKDLCLGKEAEVDIDDGQRRGDRYGREIGIVYCEGINANGELIDKDLAVIYSEYCEISEFSKEDWADC
jgi:micrococcal nuclease